MGTGNIAWPLGGGGSFSLNLYSKAACEHSRSHSFCQIIMKHGQNICFIEIADKFKNDCVQLKNMAARRWGSFLYMYTVKTCEHF